MTRSAFDFIEIEQGDAGVATVWMNRPPANAVDRAMYIELADLFRDPDRFIPGVKAIVLTGRGRHFCAGNDLDEFATMTPENGAERMWRVREAFFAVQECVVPVIGAVQGAALGTGLCLAVACDFMVAAKDASLGLPELTVGVMGGARHLARIAAQPIVRRMYFTGQPMRAEELAAAGGGLFVCEPEEVLAEARRYATRAAGFSPTATRLAKQILNRIEWMDIRTGYEFEQGYTVRMSSHHDSKEALAAFREKRDARYRPLDPSWTMEV
ncbi:enoyl-CoA hydratase-related protein [Rhizorhabdus wittichii]|uniref:enoyl-CoA hydratase-related protein n=1 Tax=Rhizorhabdus wittichii TaxID=160791 RepID=UPI0002FC5CB6|nr:enoyl-CoA hydratase-related protein [Rhizorhabdus wittichii]